MYQLLAHAGASKWLSLKAIPIHPILVNFTAALVPTSFAAELLGRFFRKPSLSATGWWTILLATLVTPLTAAAGWYWMRNMDMPGMDTERMAIHEWLGISLSILFVGLTIWRGLLFRRDQIPSLSYLSVLLLLVALLTLQGHLGGAMSFGSEPSQEQATVPSTTAAMHMTPQVVVDTGHPPAATSMSTDDGWADSIHVKGNTK